MRMGSGRIGAVLVAGILGLVWGAPIVAQMIDDVDFPFHLETAAEFASTGRITMPHFLLQAVLGAIDATGLFASLEHAGVALFTFCYAASAALICWYIAKRTGGVAGIAASVALAMAVLMAAPIVPAGAEDLFLIGYFPANAYHNPTMVIAKPLLVLTLISAVAALTRTGRPSTGELAWLASPVVLLGFAKPNYLGCVVPALIGVALWHQWRGDGPVSRNGWIRIGVVAGAAVGTVAATFALYRVLAIGAEAGVVFAPLTVIGHYTDVDAASIAGALVASLAFPLAAIALWPRAAWGDPGLPFAWIATAVGLFISYFLAEAGSRLYDGNFLWTGQMAVLVLFVASAGFVAAQLAAGADAFGRRELAAAAAQLGRVAAAGFVLWLHVDAGIRHVQMKVSSSQWLAFWT